jgi:DNA-binding PadR family transcriptional regulator
MSMTRAGYVTHVYRDDKRVALYQLSAAGKNYLADNPRATDIDKYIVQTK